MKTKKFMSLILALAMAFSLAVSAFASGTTATPIANTDVTDIGKIDTAVTTVNVGYQAPTYKLAQATFDTTDPTKATSVSAVAFRLNGDMVPNPKDAPWGKEDKLTVSVAWKFVPGQQT